MEATLIFPHQLFSSHPAVARNRKILIFQDPIFINDHIYKSKFHKSKILLHLLSTKEFHKSLLNKKYSSELIGIKEIEKGINPSDKLILEIKYASGEIKKIETLCRIDTKNELEYYKNGGILQYVLRNMI